MNTKTVFLYALLLFGLFLFGLSSCKREINKEGTGDIDFSGDINPGVIAGDGSKTGDSSGDGSKTGDSSGDGSTTGDSSGDGSKSGGTSLPRTYGPSKLNDTGITWGGNFPSGNNTGCTGEVIAQQDCSQGRDALAAAGKLTKTGAGSAGFDYTKLGKDGTALTVQNGAWSDNGSEAAGTRWSCVKDNHTGLVWEVKTNDGSAPTGTKPTVSQENIHHKNNTYRWGGLTAMGRDRADKEGTYYDDWNGLVNGTNSEKLCGFDDWRIPTIEELFSIVNKGRHNPAIDTAYFPNTSGTIYWSSLTYATNYVNAWLVHFLHGGDYNNYRYFSYSVRLVRFGS